jgi:hypothetical protein
MMLLKLCDILFIQPTFTTNCLILSLISWYEVYNKEDIDEWETKAASILALVAPAKHRDYWLLVKRMGLL